MAENPDEVAEMLDRARRDDPAATQELIELHRPRLRELARVRLDDRLAARVDPSDVVQEALLEASQRLPEYLRDEPVPFYVWLRNIALERINRVRRQHLYATKRSVLREDPVALSSASVNELGRLLVNRESSPSRRLQQKELKAQVKRALAALSEPQREVLIMKYLEHLTSREIAAATGRAIRTVQALHREALEQMKRLLQHE